ncbi:MAG: hypothetical protein AB7K09_25540, partial [Planctomycetota bacterium]
RVTESLSENANTSSDNGAAVTSKGLVEAVSTAVEPLRAELAKLGKELQAVSSRADKLAKENAELRQRVAEMGRVEADIDPLLNADAAKPARQAPAKPAPAKGGKAAPAEADPVLAALDGNDDGGDDDDGDDAAALTATRDASTSGDHAAAVPVTLDGTARQTLARINALREVHGPMMSTQHVWNEASIFYGKDGRERFYRDLDVLDESGKLVGLVTLRAELMDRRGELSD